MNSTYSTYHWRTAQFTLGALLALSLAVKPAQAARPMGVDDTGILDVATCQVEAWQDHDADTRELHLAPSCGVLPGLEVNLDLIRGTPNDTQADGRYVGLRWSPDFAQWQDWRFGLSTG